MIFNGVWPCLCFDFEIIKIDVLSQSISLFHSLKYGTWWDAEDHWTVRWHGICRVKCKHSTCCCDFSHFACGQHRKLKEATCHRSCDLLTCTLDEALERNETRIAHQDIHRNTGPVSEDIPYEFRMVSQNRMVGNIWRNSVNNNHSNTPFTSIHRASVSSYSMTKPRCPAPNQRPVETT